MRILSALGFGISITGLLLAVYVLLGIVPNLEAILNDVSLKENEFSQANRLDLMNQLNLFSIWCLVIGVLSVLFCSTIYLQKKTRMTLIGTIIGFFVAVVGMIYLLS